MKIFLDKVDLFSILIELEKSSNNGRGVGAIRDIIHYYDKGNLEAARSVFEHDGDKIAKYPEMELVIENLLRMKGRYNRRFRFIMDLKRKVSTWDLVVYEPELLTPEIKEEIKDCTFFVIERYDGSMTKVVELKDIYNNPIFKLLNEKCLAYRVNNPELIAEIHLDKGALE